VLVVAGVAGVAVGSILPLPGRTKVATPLGNGTRTSAAARPASRVPAVPACVGNADAFGAPSRQAQDWVSNSSKLTTSSWAHWDHAAELLLKAAQTRKKSDIEAATEQMERVLRRDNCL
jgi:hypothetical protein